MTDMHQKMNLSYHLEIDELVRVSEQLQKDFLMYNVPIDISGIYSLDDLVEVFSCVCDELLQCQPTKLSQIIYRIDLNENLVSQALTRENSRGIPAELASLMIMRTQTKVKLRKTYSAELKKKKKLPRY